jgi:hypothetical protein
LIKNSNRVNTAPALKPHYLKAWMANHALPDMTLLLTRQERRAWLARSAMYHFGVTGEPNYPLHLPPTCC